VRSNDFEIKTLQLSFVFVLIGDRRPVYLPWLILAYCTTQSVFCLDDADVTSWLRAFVHLSNSNLVKASDAATPSGHPAIDACAPPKNRSTVEKLTNLIEYAGGGEGGVRQIAIEYAVSGAPNDGFIYHCQICAQSSVCMRRSCAPYTFDGTRYPDRRRRRREQWRFSSDRKQLVTSWVGPTRRRPVRSSVRP